MHARPRPASGLGPGGCPSPKPLVTRWIRLASVDAADTVGVQSDKLSILADGAVQRVLATCASPEPRDSGLARSSSVIRRTTQPGVPAFEEWPSGHENSLVRPRHALGRGRRRISTPPYAR